MQSVASVSTSFSAKAAGVRSPDSRSVTSGEKECVVQDDSKGS